MPRKNKPVIKDMYWFAHGGVETDKCITQRADEDETDLMGKQTIQDRRIFHEDSKLSSKDISLTVASCSSGPASLERDDKLHSAEKRMAVEERRKLLWEAEQEKNDAVMKKHQEREAALEARRNAQRSTISFAFGSSVPRNVDTLQVHQNNESDIMSRSFTAGGLSSKGDDIMTRSMTATISAPRGRRKNDLMPTVPYDRTATPRVITSSSSRRRSVSMTRLDQLAQPRKHYVEATKAHSTASSGTSSMLKDICSPNRPLSSASEHSGGRLSSSVTRRVRTTPRKPRPVSIAGTIPDQKPELKVIPIKRTYTPLRKSVENSDIKKAQSPIVRNSLHKTSERLKPSPRPSTAPVKSTTPKIVPIKITPKPKKPEPKQVASKVSSSPKIQSSKNSLTNKKKNDLQASSSPSPVKEKSEQEEKSASPPPDSDTGNESDRNGKRIISEEEAKAALAEKRRLAREQAEKEAELERQKQEELKKLEEERLQQEEEEQRKMEEEHLHLIEEHRRQEEEKLKKAIEDQEQKEEEERAKRDEEIRLKTEMEKKIKEEAEKLRIELEEKLRKEEEERAERKKRLEKIMSRTRGKSSGISPSGSISGSDQLDSGENQQEGFSSGANSLESNDGKDLQAESSSDEGLAKMEISSTGSSTATNGIYEFGSNDVSLNSNDLMIPASGTSSQDNSINLEKEVSLEESINNSESVMAATPINTDLLEDNITSTGDLDVSHVQGTTLGEVEHQVESTVQSNNRIENEVGICSKDSVSDVEESAVQHIDNQQSTLEVKQNETDDSGIISIGSQDKHLNEIELTGELNFQKDDEIINPIPNYLENENNITQNASLISNVDSNLKVYSTHDEVDALKADSFSETDANMKNSLFIENSEIEDTVSKTHNFYEQSHPLQEESNTVTKNNLVSNEDFFNPTSSAEKFQDSFKLNCNNPFELQTSFDMTASMVINKNSDDIADISTANNVILLNNTIPSPDFKTADVEKKPDVDNFLVNEIITDENKFNLPHDHMLLESEQINIKNQTFPDPSEQNLDNVTLIKEEGGENYVGIISSIDNDNISNNYSQLHEQLTNFECASTTDSEESSLDSNLSQVATGDDSDKPIFVQLNNGENTVIAGGHFDNPFTSSAILNQTSIPQLNHFPVSEVYSNGHDVNSSSDHKNEFVELDGNGILCVDHPKNNIFDNVDTISYSEVSPDPFLVKGNSKQISGNPFLRQEEQNQVLMTSDFLN